MAKFVPLKFWVILAVYLALASPLAVGWFDTWLATNSSWLGTVVAGFLTSRIIAIIIWALFAAIVVYPGWRLLWKMPLLGQWLANRYFPDLNGEWIVTIQSNWPVVDSLKSITASTEITFDPFNNDMPDLLEASFDVKIKQSWFWTDVTFLPNDKTPLLASKTISVEFFKPENGSKSIAWIYEQVNKQDNTQRLAVTDQPKFHGSAVLTVNEDSSELQGQYWQNRSWSRGLNAAGLITLKRATK